MVNIVRQFIRENIRFAMGLDRFVTMNALSDVVGTRHSTNPIYNIHAIEQVCNEIEIQKTDREFDSEVEQ